MFIIFSKKNTKKSQADKVITNLLKSCLNKVWYLMEGDRYNSNYFWVLSEGMKQCTGERVIKQGIYNTLLCPCPQLGD